MKYFSWFLFFFFSLPSSVFALEAERLTISPVFSQIMLRPQEQEVSSDVVVTNQLSQTQYVETFALDFFQSDENGGVALLAPALVQQNFRLANYMQIEPKQFALKSGESKTLHVTVHDLATLSPGGHYGAVIARFAPEEKIQNREILPALSSLVLLHKQGGEIYKLVGKIDADNLAHWWQFPKQIPLLFANDGNVQLIPHGKITVKDVWGRLVAVGIVNDSSHFVLPQAKRRMRTELNRVAFLFPISIYTLDFSGKTNIGEQIYHSNLVFVYISPWFLASILALVVTFIFWRRKIYSTLKTKYQFLCHFGKSGN